MKEKTVELSKRSREQIVRLQEITGAESASEVIRRALNLFETLVDRECVRATLRVTRNGEEQTVVIVL